MVRPSKSEYHNYYGEYAAAPTAPAPTAGDMYFDTSTTTMMYWDGAAWQPFGGGGALVGAYGELYYYPGTCGGVVFTLSRACGACIGNRVVIQSSGGRNLVVGETLLTTCTPANGRITIDPNGDGRYRVKFSVSFTCNPSTEVFFHVYKNGVIVGKISAKVETSNTSYEYHVAPSGILDLAAGDVVDVQVTTSVAATVYITYFNFNINRIEDTSGGVVDHGWKDSFGRAGTEDYQNNAIWHTAKYEAHFNSNFYGHLWYSNWSIQNCGPSAPTISGWYTSNILTGHVSMNVINQTNVPANKRLDMLGFICIAAISATRAMEFGWSQGTQAKQPNTIAFEFDATVGDVNWMCVIRSTAGGVYRQSSGVPMNLGQFYKLCISVDITGQVAYFYIDDVLVATITAAMAGGWPTGLSYPGLKNTGSGSNTYLWRTPWFLAIEI